MSLISPETLRVAGLIVIVNIHQSWHRLVNSIVPDSYLDEVFHVPQAQAYWAGNWTHWDDKITTPPALYVFSYLFNCIRRFGWSSELTVQDLRTVNVVLLYFLLIALSTWISISGKTTKPHSVLQPEYVILVFPLFFFFSGLYYTDLFSAFTVVLTYISWTASTRRDGMRRMYQLLHVVFGLISLASRQTNIFWVGIFLAGLQVVESTRRAITPGQMHDPKIHQIWFEDIPTTCISLAQAAIPIIPRLVLDVCPSLTLIASSGLFIIWNGGVVLGDKSNHIATIHTPQMLYIWPFIVFFSWPVLIPQLTNPSQLLKSLPRVWIIVSVITLMTLAVHFNTIVHPFSLADNRHYVFYIFRILRRHWSIKYLAVPIYAVCAWLVINALADDPRMPQPAPPSTSNNKSKVASNLTNQSSTTTTSTPTRSSPTLLFLLTWLISTTLSLISTPLVEPRYFIIPWLIWRLHIPNHPLPSSPTLDESVVITSPSSSSSEPPPHHNPRPLTTLSAHALTIEFTWYLLINLATCYIFLYRGFSWPQEEGRVQRFMW